MKARIGTARAKAAWHPVVMRGRRIASRLRRPTRLMLLAGILFGIPVLCVGFLIAPSFQAPPTRGGDENLRLTIAPLAGDLAANINVSYSTVVHPANSFWAGRETDVLEETLNVWWYPTQEMVLPSTTPVGVYADGANGGAGWTCQSSSPPGKGGDPDNFYYLSDYPSRIPTDDEYFSGPNVPPHTSATIRVARRTVPTNELVTAGIPPSPAATPTPQPAPTPSPVPLPPIEPYVASPPDALVAPPPIVVSASPPIPTTDQYELHCARSTPTSSASEALQRISVPEISVTHRGFAANVDAEAFAYFAKDWSIVSPIVPTDGTVDANTPGLVSFAYHRPIPSSNVIISGSTVLGGSFVVSNPHAQAEMSLRREMGFLVLGAWIAMLVGTIPPEMLRKLWRPKGAVQPASPTSAPERFSTAPSNTPAADDFGVTSRALVNDLDRLVVQRATDQWVVLRRNSSRASARFRTRAEAVDRAEEIVRKAGRGGKVLIQDT